MTKEMKVVGIAVDPATQSPIVILKDGENQHVLPIWIGILEANAIAVGLENVKLPRPMTHDLFKNVMDELDVHLRKIEVTDIKDNTYFAAIHLETDGRIIVIDSRPSDAIAIALRYNAPIVVHEAVIEKAVRIDSSSTGGEKDKWTELLEKLDPEDFSKYKM